MSQNIKQNELALLGGMQTGGIREVPYETVAMCRNYQDALKLGIYQSQEGLTRGQVADELGIDGGQFNRILNCDLYGAGKSVRYLNPIKFRTFEQTVKNNALSRFFEMEAAGLLNHQKMNNQRRAEMLRAEADRLEREAS